MPVGVLTAERFDRARALDNPGNAAKKQGYAAAPPTTTNETPGTQADARAAES
eukprot:CAMPEP_0118937296 /NCGR_PEP_ID=MMETSP1169-20130426/22272_1 /TAXON_ID=36882 /ORGANISM="Pyramimonas obovata, Strain CCMP722" /LENGTH=52 /DNA_ID=CAMNT_0006880887 /DNA_START=129 /DNA_END=285 /DNA_ORIENTATION=-